MARRRPNRIARPHAEKSLPAGLSSAGGQIRTAEQINAQLAQSNRTGSLAMPLPRDVFPYQFGPNIPLTPAPLDPTRSSGRAEPRLWEYPVSWNLPGVTQGRLVPWKTLRDAALLPLIRDCIRIRKQELMELEWDFGLTRRAVERAQADDPDSSRLDVERKLRERLRGSIDSAVGFWEQPDRGNGHTFNEWVSKAMEEHLVLDALAIYPRLTKGGDFYGFEVVDGSTIKPLLDHRGGRPMPPEPAYQQIIHGFPRGEFMADVSDNADGATVVRGGYTADQLIYVRREVRTDTPYGLSPVETCLLDIDLWMKRVGWLRAEYTDGMQPSGWLRWLSENTSGWTAQQIAEYERELNDYYSGNTGNRHRWRVLPPGLIPDEANNDQAEKYKPEFDLHLLKLVVAHFDLTIHELGFTEAKGLGSVGHAEGQENLSERKGRVPAAKWWASLITQLSRTHLGLPAELEFRWLGLDDEETGDEEQLLAQVAAGITTINEGRDDLGRPRFAFPEADKPALFSPSGITFIEGAEQRAEQAAELEREIALKPPAAPQAGGPGVPGAGSAVDRSGGDDASEGASRAKTAEAAAYRRWVSKGRSAGRRFELSAITTPSDLDIYGIDPALISFKAADDPGKALSPTGLLSTG